jgi:hypothetical protein
MALVKCKECGKEVSSKAETCPNCGVTIKKKSSSPGCLGTGLLIILALFFIAPFLPDEEPAKKTATGSKKTKTTEAKAIRTYQEGRTVRVGYMAYRVISSRWQDEIIGTYGALDPPGGKYLIIKLLARNRDMKERTIPPFKLVDERGSEYGTADQMHRLDTSIDPFDDLNPDMEQRGTLLFDVPPDREYKLKVSGGYWSKEAALIRLDPR